MSATLGYEMARQVTVMASLTTAGLVSGGLVVISIIGRTIVREMGERERERGKEERERGEREESDLSRIKCSNFLHHTLIIYYMYIILYSTT